VGKWYKFKSTAEYGLFEKRGNNKGFNNKTNLYNTASEWTETMGMNYESSWELADMKEVKKLLLAEAKKRYPKGTKFYNASNVLHTVGNGEWYMDKSGISYIGNYVFLFHKGKWAEIVESKLMLGDEKVTIKNNRVCAADGNVYIPDWLTWFKTIDHFYDHFMRGSIELRLGSYKTTSVTGMYTEIGCIKQITYDQLKAVTEAVKKL